jgi:hypothetical protein
MMPRVSEPEQATPELGPIATEVVYEDDHVRIWTHHLEPGEAGPPHRHELDYVIVDVAGDRIAADPVPGTGGEYDQYVEAPVRRGKGYFLKRGGVERAINVGSTPYRTVIVELKDQAPST